MLHPDMATLLAFVTTDAAGRRDGPPGGAGARRRQHSFNCVTVDGDTSTNDTLHPARQRRCGRSAVRRRVERSGGVRGRACSRSATRSPSSSSPMPRAPRRHFRVAVDGAADRRPGARRRPRRRAEPAREDGGPRRRSELGPHRRRPRAQRRAASASTAAASPSAASSSSIAAHPEQVDPSGSVVPPFAAPSDIAIDLGAGDGAGHAWGCDLSADYVRINADYTT